MESFLHIEDKKAIDENRYILSHIVHGVLYCGRQGIALRGDKESMSGTSNPANFIAYLKMATTRDPLVHKHLNMCSSRYTNAKYISPRSQNEIIIIGTQLNRNELVNEVKSAKFFSVIVDEVTSHKKELYMCSFR